jgi:hypothetical protein
MRDIMIVKTAGIFHIKFRIGSANVAARAVFTEYWQTQRSKHPFHFREICYCYQVAKLLVE